MSAEPEPKDRSNEPDADKTADPRDLVIKPGYVADNDPNEVIDNPAVTPQMLDEKDQRGDLQR